ncbi:SnoaL-like domain-containing protein [Aquimarina gracilis]|uniref:SnoaL-like domain-containing protein n=1 Tax=Aquimarina gracilis TaxID=874422 RepID=A0ABU6A0L3_9FLAO|nr:SnoaL-like domain-containing protein [Aquimarina gracilis]MEB3347698.1 SnoaL-like domain-containing protein [Aquimarina gracilis]
MINTIANQLVTLLRQKRFLEAQETLFASEAVSLEPEFNKERSTFGLEAMTTKEKRFLANIKQWNHFEVSDPLISKNHFIIHMITDVILKNNDNIHIDEIIIYEVDNNKIIKEQFFYR